MALPVLLTPEAELEIAEAFDWYEQRSMGLGAEFLHALDTAFSSACQEPARYPVWQRGARRVLLHRFPYAVFYLMKTDVLIVFACFHGKRNPRILLQRVRRAG